MLSILIPTYNFSIVSLVKSLHDQLKNQNISYEIICLDNNSNSEISTINAEINKYNFCIYELLSKDVGRSKIRNLLAEKSKYKWLLFLDADVLPVNNNFIERYLKSVNDNVIKVIYGGLKYYDKKPTSDKLLRWVYGKKREEISLDQRIKTDEIHFSSANFLIDKRTFNKIKFDELLTKYGHEDTLLGIELRKKNISITQIDNPVYHLGLDLNDLFIEKSRKAVENLMYLQKKNKININDNRLLKSFNNLTKIKMDYLMALFFKKYANKMKENLNSRKPSLFIYDLYRLGYLSKIYKK